METRNPRTSVGTKKSEIFFSSGRKREANSVQNNSERVKPPSRGSIDSSGGEKEKMTVRILDFVIGFSILAIFFGIPLFFTGITLQGVVFDKQIYFYLWLLIGLIAWTTKGVIVGDLNIRRTPLDLPIMGFLVASLLSAIFSVDHWHSFWGAFSDPSRGFMNIVAIAVAYYLIFSNLTNKRIQNIVISILASGFIVSIWTFLAILNIKFLPDKIAALAPISLTGSIVGVSSLISALIPLLVISILKVSENEKLGRLSRSIINSFLAIDLVMSLILVLALYGFVPWVGFFIGIALLLIFVLSQIVRPRYSLAWIPLAVFVAVMVIRMIGPDVIKIAKINISEVKALDYKISWQVASESMKNKFLLGTGPATYGYDFSLYKPREFNDNIFYNLRYLQGTGIVLESISTLGGVGTFFLVIIILSFVSVSLYLMAREKEKNKLLSLGILSSAIILVFDVTVTKLEGTILIMAALLATLALAALTLESDSQENKWTLSLKASPKFALALAFISMVVSTGVVFLFVFLGKVYVADIYAGKSVQENIDKKQALTHLASAIKYYPNESKYYSQAGQDFMLLANEEAMKDADQRDVNEIKNDINDSIVQAEKGVNMNSKDVGAVEALAQIHENAGLYDSGYLESALDKYQSASTLEPHNPIFYAKMGQIKLGMAAAEKDQNKKKQLIAEAKNLTSKSLEEKEDLADGYYQLSVAESASGESDQAITDAEKSFSLSAGNNADYNIGLARLYQDRGKENDLKAAEQLYKLVISQNDQNINAHFYLGLLHEKQKNKDDAKNEYKRVADLMTDGKNSETKKQIEKMISNIDSGVENSPESLGLVSSEENNSTAASTTTEQ